MLIPSPISRWQGPGAAQKTTYKFRDMLARPPKLRHEPGVMMDLCNFTRIIAAAVACLISGCTAARTDVPRAGSERLVERSRPAMGTELRLTAWTADETKALGAFETVFDEFDRLEQILSHWRDGSDVQRLNAAAGKHPVSVGTEIRDVLRNARQVSEWTDGKFDVTFGVMSGLWKFDYQNKDGTIPDRGEVERRRKLINYRDLEIDEHAGTAFLRRQGMIVNLGGIAKGYAVDRAREIFRDRGLRDFLIQFGGDMYAAGRRDGRPWRLGIQDPRGPTDRIFAAVDVSDSTFSTSGDYERFFIQNGRRYHHIIDPDTGEPAMKSRSVTIMSDNATIADGLSTGVFILGPQAGMELIERLPNVDGVIVGADNTVLVSSGLQGRLTLLATPTNVP
jgi:thiamine biosynthesis lipoprotein